MILYDDLLASNPGSRGKLSDELIAELEDAWLKAYRQASSHKLNVLQFEDSGFTFLYDQTSAVTSDVEDRLVVGYGYSVRQSEDRDNSRIAGLLGGGIDIPEKGTFDKGHVLAHSMGGGMDVNLFPQRPELNRGISADGKVYRKMETYVAKHPGTFVFSRLIYTDASWVPSSVEYGILLPKGKFWINQFKN